MSRSVNIGIVLPFIPPRRSFTEIDRDEIVRQTLEEAARQIQAISGNPTYKRAWDIAAQKLRLMKP
jgi:hypothetical protein